MISLYKGNIPLAKNLAPLVRKLNTFTFKEKKANKFHYIFRDFTEISDKYLGESYGLIIYF